ncbi:MAG: hypothetical protein COT15_00115 [Candidatus Diapherotrites archaeon CG08_land_8_20_14_0_20_34_12]|nr:MAG: hypothetical protein COT15_00115 [Candidatus Diapherotrites archaeon CG08_land_8_20_14_0_20_34_12]
MASEKEYIFVVCVDRDNDIGRKTGVEGPIIGRENNLNTANKLILADPGEADANSMFAAVKKFDEVKEHYKDVEIVTLTGVGKSGFVSDKRINEQLDMLTEKYKINGFVLITDGAEDDQIMPVLQSRAKIISKELIIVKQAKEVESLYFTIKETLSDPYFARVIFGIPGVILLIYAITLVLGAQELFIQGISFIIGIYLLIKGFGIELFISRFTKDLRGAISAERVSFPFYIGSIFIFIFGVYSTVTNTPFTGDVLKNWVKALQVSYLFFVLAIICIILAKSLDILHFKKAFYLRKYILYFVSTILGWLIIDSATLVFLGIGDLNFFLLTILISFITLFIAFRATESIDIRRKITEIIVNLPVYTINNNFKGKVIAIDKKKNVLVVETSEKNINVKEGDFFFKNGRIYLNT